MTATAAERAMTEAELKAEVVRLAVIAGWRVFSLPMIRNRRPVKSGASGYPDLTLARDGRVIWLELKTEDGVLSKEQIAWWDAIAGQRSDLCYYVIRPHDLTTWSLGRVLA